MNNNYGASLNFALPKDNEAHYLAIHAWGYRQVLKDLDYWLETQDKDDAFIEAYAKGIKQKISELSKKHNVLIHGYWGVSYGRGPLKQGQNDREVKGRQQDFKEPSKGPQRSDNEAVY